MMTQHKIIQQIKVNIRRIPILHLFMMVTKVVVLNRLKIEVKLGMERQLNIFLNLIYYSLFILLVQVH